MGRPQGWEVSTSDHEVTWGDFSSVFKRYWWAIVLVVVAATAGALVFSAAQPQRYRAEAKLVNTATFIDSVQLGLDIGGVYTTITSPALLGSVAAAYGGPLPGPADFAISAAPAPMAANSAGGDPLSLTRLVAVTAESGSAALSAKLANAYAKAFVEYRTQSVRANARKSAQIVRRQLAAFALPQVTAAGKVDYLASRYLTLTQDLTQLEATAATGNGGYSVLAEAVPPTEPFSPQPVRGAIFGFGVGVLLAFILVVVLQRFGRGVGGEREVVALLRFPILGRLSSSRDERSQTGRLVSLVAPTGRAAEAYRRLRASLPAVLAGDGVKTLLFTSACEGEGRSAALANTAVALARTGSRVVVVDADLRSPSLHRYFGLPNDEGVISVGTGRMSLGAALQSVDVALERESSVSGSPATGGEGRLASLDVLTSGPSVLDPGELIAGKAMARVLAELKTSADVVLIDSPGVLATADALSLAGIVDGLVFVVDAHHVTRRALRQSKESLDLLPCHILGILLMRRQRGQLLPRRRRERQVRPAQSDSRDKLALADREQSM